MSAPPLTLSGIFEQAGISPRLYHLGREIAPCSPEAFQAFEDQRLPWPLPWQQRARVAITFAPPGDSTSTPLVWFLAFPLDEQGLLEPAMRDGFIHRLLATLGQQPLDALAPVEGVDPLMKDNPLAFDPPPLTMALFHALAARDAGQPASRFSEMAESYFNGLSAREHGSSLGWQGVADIVARKDETRERQWAMCLDALDDQALQALCACLEFFPPTTPELLEALAEQNSVRTGEVAYSCARAGLASREGRASQWADTLLGRDALADEDLAILAVRGWHHLEHETRLASFLEHLARSSTLDMSRWLKELALLPRLRLPLIMMLRDAPEDSALALRLSPVTRH
ncbi:DUF3549 family protein [Larsenimonas rhizosphaerae]|uniref:DUF3549 family protein n=1 Tax=Larsenimonas rhizosphaerae TaxID=2944682 RepID=UPI0020336865|nr:DUF3549 family protein [Larsenimonas rhizosphaerae]MCM2132069.1 DUF3549 family protein [Larsenimonas rhizosphaerae]